jgi:cytochrome c oxidase assembly factor CtaG
VKAGVAAVPGWTFEPTIALPLFLTLALYLWLYARGAQDRVRGPWPVWQVVSFTAGLAAALCALLSPLDGYADTYFWAHMTQHMTLLIIAPPLITLGLPVRGLLRATPRLLRTAIVRPLARNWVRREAGRLLLHPITVFVLFNANLGLWHIPRVFLAAQSSEVLHSVEHVTYLAAGMLLWWLLVEPVRLWPRDAELPKIAFLVATHLPMLLLGQLLFAFTNVPLYSTPDSQLLGASYDALSDQRLGGGIMFGLDMAVTFGTVSVLFGRYLATQERRQRALERQQDLEQQLTQGSKSKA